MFPWIACYGSVEKKASLRPLIEMAGKDISHWFDASTKDLKKRVDQTSGLRIYVKQGFFGVPGPVPSGNWDTSIEPWWLSTTYRVGALSARTRYITIVNTLSKQSHTLEVASEETLDEICDRYGDICAHCRSYVFKRFGEVLDMAKTLEENGIEDDREELESCGLDPSEHIPIIHIYFDDDLSVA